MKTVGKGRNAYLVMRENTNYHFCDGKRHTHIRKADCFADASWDERLSGEGEIVSIILVDNAKAAAKRRAAWLKAKQEVAKITETRKKGLSKLTKEERRVLGLDRRG